MTQQEIKVKVKVDFVPEKAATKAMKGSLEEIEKSFDGLIGKETASSMASLKASLEKIEGIFKDIGDSPISDEQFKNVNKALQTVNKDFKEIITSLGEVITMDVNTDELDKKIKKSAERADELKEKLEAARLANDDKTSPVYKKEKMGKMFRDNKLLSGFDGNTTSLKIPGFGNRAEFDIVEKGLIKLKARYTELTAATKLTAAEQRELNALNVAAVKEKIPAMEEIIDSVKKAQVAEAATFEQRFEDYNKEIELLDKLNASKKAALKTGGPQGEVLADATEIGNQARKQLKGSADSRRTQKAIDEAAKGRNAKEPTTITGDAANELIEKYFTMNAALAAVKTIARKTISVIGELDAAFVSIAVVTQYSNKEVWGMYDAFNSIASSSGFTTAAIGQVASEYFRQGESYSDVILLTEAAAKAAKVAGIDASDSVRYLTSAVKAYRLEASDAMLVSDRFAALAASTATDYEGLATAMSKVAAQASSSGVEMDNLMGMMATAMEVTQEAPENIGTAFKTIFARMSEIKDYGKVLEDGVDANRVEKALKMVNVELFDQNNQMRNLDQVLLEVGGQWGTLNRSQKAYIATTLAGTRQQTRLLAVLENMERVEKNIETSKKSAGATESQQLKNTESLAFAFNRVNVAFEKFTKNVANNAFILAAIKTFASGLEKVIGLTDHWSGQLLVLGASLAAIVLTAQSIFTSEKLKPVFDMFSTKLPLIKEGFDQIGFSAIWAAIQIGDFGLASKIALGGNPIGLAIALGTTVLALIAGANALGLFDTAQEAARKRSESLRKEITKLSAEMYDIQKSYSDLSELIDEYQQLEDQVFKTVESLERQKEILQLIQDMDVKDKYIEVVLDGKLNVDISEEWKKDLKAAQQEKFEEQIKANLEFSFNYENFERSDQELAQLATLQQQLVDGNFDEWEKLIDKRGEQFLSYAKKAADLVAKDGLGYYGADGVDYSGYELTEDQVTGETFAKIMGIPGVSEDEVIKVTLRFADVDLTPVDAFMNYMDELENSSITTQQYIDDIENMNATHIAEGTSLYETAKAYAHLGAKINDIMVIQEAFDIMKGHGIKLLEDEKEAMVSAIASNDYVKFLTVMETAYKKSDTAQVSFTQGLIQMGHELSKVSFADIIEGLKNIENSDQQIEKLNKSFETFNSETIDGIMELIDRYKEFPEVLDAINESISNNEGINVKAQEAIADANKRKTMAMMENEKEALIAENKLIAIDMEIFKTAIQDKVNLGKLASDSDIEVSGLTSKAIIENFNTEGEAYQKSLQQRVDLAADFGRKRLAAEDTGVNQNITDWAKNYGADLNYTTQQSSKYQAIVAILGAELDSLGASYQANAAKIEVLNTAMNKVESNTWGKAVEDGAEKTKDSAKDAADAIELYEGALNKLYVAQKKLEMIDFAKNVLDAEKAYLESKEAASGLAGAVTDLSERSSATVGDDMYHALSLESKEIENLIKVQSEYRDELVNNLDPALRSSYTLMDGKVIPVSKNYAKLTADQMEEVDDFAESVNGLTDEMNKNTIALYSNAEEMNKILTARRDTIIEYETLMIEAIKNEEKKQIESFKKIIDANKKYLQERKALYEESFKDQDHEQDTDDIDKERLKVIEKIAALEAAHDLTSIQKKEEYLKELEKINTDYNQKILERNRAALLESLDNQIEFQDEVYASEEESYLERVENIEWLEARILQIQVNGAEAILEYLKVHHPKMAEATTNMKDKLLGEWGTLITTVEGYSEGFGDLEVKPPETSDYIEALNDLVSKTNQAATDVELAYSRIKTAAGNSGGGGGGGGGGEASAANPESVARERTVYYYKGRRFMVHDQAKGERQNDVGYLQTAYKKADGRKHQNQYYYDQFIEAKKALEAAEAYKITSKVEKYKTGGTTERTGMHWLDGKPGAPERVLSPGQNKEFEKLIKTLRVESTKPDDNRDIVDSLMNVVKAVYDSSQENANEIATAIKAIDVAGENTSIKTIARKHGISLNRRGDK